MQVLHGKVLRIDEILTMSCWVAATTSDHYWYERYQGYVPILDQTISELIKSTPPGGHAFIQETMSANEILVDYEIEALNAARYKNRDYAVELLTSPDYASQKERYSEGMRLLDLELQEHFQELLRDEYQQIKQREMLIVVVVAGLAIFWIIIYLVI